MLKRPFSERMVLRPNRSPGSSGLTAHASAWSGATWAAGLLWLAAGLSAGYWALQAGGQGPWVAVKGLAPSVPQADMAAVGRALGATLVVAASPKDAPTSPSRVRLLGLVAQGRNVGAALLAVDDQPPRPWLVGAEVTDGLVLQSVDKLGAKLGESRWGETTLELVMPEPKNLPSSGVPRIVNSLPKPAPRNVPTAPAALRGVPTNPPLQPGVEGLPIPG